MLQGDMGYCTNLTLMTAAGVLLQSCLNVLKYCTQRKERFKDFCISWALYILSPKEQKFMK